MKIAMIMSTPFPPEEGIGFHVYNISKILIQRGHDITVFTRGTFKKEKDIFNNIKIIRLPFFPLYPFHVHLHGFFLNHLFKHLEKEFDLVHVHMPLTPLIKTSLPIVTTIHSSLIEDAQHIEVVDIKSLFTKLLTKNISYHLLSKQIKASKVVNTVSNSVADELYKYYELKNIDIIGNAVDDVKFIPLEHNGEYLLYVGRLSYRKGLFDLLNAFEKIVIHYDIKLLLLGKGELFKKLKKLINQKKLQDKVIFGGFKNHDKIISIYQKAKIFISPSSYESGPLTLLEAMACGKPVIATNVGIALDCIEDGKNGILINPNSSDDIINSVYMLLENEELCKKLGENARKTIENAYTWDLVVDKVEKIYMDLEGIE